MNQSEYSYFIHFDKMQKITFEDKKHWLIGYNFISVGKISWTVTVVFIFDYHLFDCGVGQEHYKSLAPYSVHSFVCSRTIFNPEPVLSISIYC